VSLTVCLAPANTIGYPQGGGHLWVYLNWALALRAIGCRVIWLEGVDDAEGDDSLARRRRWRGRDVRECVATLKAHLGRYGFAEALALYSVTGDPLPDDLAAAGLDLDAAADGDLLLNLSHALPESVVRRFRRSAFVDTDPGLFQVWMTTGDICVAPHDVYFTIGETVGTPAARFPDCGLRWHYTPPPVFLAEWRERLGALGWGVREAWDVSATPEQYRAYIQSSRGEFSCVKPYCVQFVNSWTSDRTICYLASGKPAVVQHTGPSRLPDAGGGLFRFRSMDEAVRALAAIEADYERHCRLARQLAEEHFDGCRVVTRVLERALT